MAQEQTTKSPYNTQKLLQMPSSPEAEKALLSCCFIRPEIIPSVRTSIVREDFWTETNGLVWDALCFLGNMADPISVAGWLDEKGELEKCGGIISIMDLANHVSTSAAWSYHAGIVSEKSTRRKIIKACQRASGSVFGADDPGAVLSELKGDIREIDSVQSDRGPVEIVNAVWSDIEARAEKGEKFIGVRTGFEVIDSRIYGMEPKTTIYLIARPSIGKTALAINIADRIKGYALFFSLESTAEAITRRRMAARTGIPLWKIRTANLQDDEYETMIQVSKDLVGEKLAVFDSPKYKNVEVLTARCESAAMDGPVSLIVVDHIQRMRSRRKFQNRHLELSWISEEMSTLAKNLNVPILILCQLNRQVEQRPAKSKYPQLFDIRESGDLEQNADQVWGLWRADKQSPECRLECLKGRDTGTWVAGLRFDTEIQRFYDSEWSEADRKPKTADYWQDK